MQIFSDWWLQSVLATSRNIVSCQPMAVTRFMRLAAVAYRTPTICLVFNYFYLARLTVTSFNRHLWNNTWNEATVRWQKHMARFTATAVHRRNTVHWDFTS